MDQDVLQTPETTRLPASQHRLGIPLGERPEERAGGFEGHDTVRVFFDSPEHHRDRSSLHRSALDRSLLVYDGTQRHAAPDLDRRLIHVHTHGVEKDPGCIEGHALGLGLLLPDSQTPDRCGSLCHHSNLCHETG